MSNIYDQSKVRVGSCARTLLADVQTLRNIAAKMNASEGYRPEYKKNAEEEVERIEAAFKLVQQAFDVLTGGKRPGYRGGP